MYCYAGAHSISLMLPTGIFRCIWWYCVSHSLLLSSFSLFRSHSHAYTHPHTSFWGKTISESNKPIVCNPFWWSMNHKHANAFDIFYLNTTIDEIRTHTNENDSFNLFRRLWASVNVCVCHHHSSHFHIIKWNKSIGFREDKNFSLNKIKCHVNWSNIFTFDDFLNIQTLISMEHHSVEYDFV